MNSSPGQPARGERGILLPNHLASSVRDPDGYGDTGNRAHHLREVTGLPVVAYERPSTATMDQLATFTIKSYLEDVDERVSELQNALEDSGINRLIITGSSAGGTEALVMGRALARAGKIAVERIIVMEPVGMWDVANDEDKNIGEGFMAGWTYFKSESRGDKTDIDSDEYMGLSKLEDPYKKPDDIASRLLNKKTQIFRAKKEVTAYYPVYMSDIGMEASRDLAHDHAEIPVNITLGDKSKAMTPELRADMAAEFEGSSVNVRFLPAHHAFPNRHEVFVHIVQKALQLLPAEVGVVTPIQT